MHTDDTRAAPPTRVAAVDVEALERDARAAIDAAASSDELDEARVRYLGRKSELKLALRQVRDRESGMALNQVRERLEAAVEARAAALEQDARAAVAAAATAGFDPTLPGEGAPGARST